MMMRSKLQNLIIEEKFQTHVELVRRKLDFEVIKDNHENKVTSEILEKYVDKNAGMPGTNYKYQKVQELIQKRRSEIVIIEAERKIKQEMD